LRGGTLLAYTMCLLLPDINIMPVIDHRWQLVLGFPFFLAIIQLLSLLLYYVSETPKGSLLANEKAEVRPSVDA
jgi:hypothetical protein